MQTSGLACRYSGRLSLALFNGKTNFRCFQKWRYHFVTIPACEASGYPCFASQWISTLQQCFKSTDSCFSCNLECKGNVLALWLKFNIWCLLMLSSMLPWWQFRFWWCIPSYLLLKGFDLVVDWSHGGCIYQRGRRVCLLQRSPNILLMFLVMQSWHCCWWGPRDQMPFIPLGCVIGEFCHCWLFVFSFEKTFLDEQQKSPQHHKLPPAASTFQLPLQYNAFLLPFQWIPYIGIVGDADAAAFPVSK